MEKVSNSAVLSLITGGFNNHSVTCRVYNRHDGKFQFKGYGEIIDEECFNLMVKDENTGKLYFFDMCDLKSECGQLFIGGATATAENEIVIKAGDVFITENMAKIKAGEKITDDDDEDEDEDEDE